MLLSSATRIGVYEIRSLIGAGGMGEVYRATDPRLKRDVAIKVLPAAFAQDPDRMHRFEFEAQAVGRLNHPNVLAVFDTGIHEGSPYLVSELLEGESLRSRLHGGKLAPQRALDYARQIASGLSAAHAAGIIHRDLKPENVFITKDGRVKILDFGLAKQTTVPSDTEQTRTLETSPGTVLGTVSYMSPEQVRGQKVDHRSDIFSFGCLLHEMLTGEQPFKGESAADTMSAILNQERPELNIAGGLAPALDRIVSHCLEKQPEARFQSAQDIAFDLASISEASPTVRVPAAVRPPSKRVALAAAMLGLGLIAGTALDRFFSPRSHPVFQRLTFRRGTIDTARFAPDRQTILYSAIWEDEPAEVFAVRLESPESRQLGFPGAGLLGISRSGELALALRQRIGLSPFVFQGVLARVPFSGGSPHSVEDQITSADWTADGHQLALVRQTNVGFQLEYPQGKVLFRSAGFISNPRISPGGDKVAFLNHTLAFDNSGSVAVVDSAGRLETLTTKFSTADGLAWSSKGNEIWFSAAETGSKQDLWAVTPSGRRRLVYRQSGSVVLHDISDDGRVLMTNVQWRQGMTFHGPSDSRERELSWLDWSLPTGISPDGRLVVFSETGEGAGGGATIYLRETSGAPAVKLGAGAFATFSPDGKYVVSTDLDGTEISIYPVGTGSVRKVRLKGFAIVMAGLLPDGKRIWFDGNEPSQGRRLYLTTMDGETPRPIIPEEAQAMPPYIADGKHLTAMMAGKMVLIPLEGGRPEPLPGVEEGERVTGWASENPSFFVFRRSDLPLKVYRVDRSTGRRSFVQEIGPSERAGIGRTGLNLLMTADGKSYLYVTRRNLSELYLVSGLK